MYNLRYSSQHLTHILKKAARARKRERDYKFDKRK